LNRDLAQLQSKHTFVKLFKTTARSSLAA